MCSLILVKPQYQKSCKSLKRCRLVTVRARYVGRRIVVVTNAPDNETTVDRMRTEIYIVLL